MKVRKRLSVIASVAFLAFLLNGPGCAALASLSDYRHWKMHYSGTALDLAFIGDGPWVMLLWAFRFLCLVDLSLSFAVDTVLLPVHFVIDLANP